MSVSNALHILLIVVLMLMLLSPIVMLFVRDGDDLEKRTRRNELKRRALRLERSGIE